jgi:transcriptional regulator with XRE-family HTH domain
VQLSDNKSLYLQKISLKDMSDLNRLKVVLAEKKRTNKWLSEQLKVTPSTVSKWCTNTSQPTIETLIKIAECLDVPLTNLLWNQK